MCAKRFVSAKYFFIALVSTILLLNLGCGRSDSVCSSVKVIKFSHVGSAEDVRQKSARKFKELVEAYTDGTIRVEIYAGGQLGGDRDAIEGVKFGTIQMTVAGIGIFANFEPKMGISSLPYLFDNIEQAWAFTDSEINTRISGLLLRQGIRVLTYWGNGFRCLTNSRHPVNSIEDIRGLTIRTPENPVILATLETMGANSSPLPWPEVYMALQQKSFDGQENPIHIIYIHKLYEVQKYLTITKHIYESMPVVISESFWKGISDEQRSAIEDAAEEVKKYNRNLIVTQTEQMLIELQAKGMVVTRPDLKQFKMATAKVRERFAEKMGEELLQQVYNFVK